MIFPISIFFRNTLVQIIRVVARCFAGLADFMNLHFDGIPVSDQSNWNKALRSPRDEGNRRKGCWASASETDLIEVYAIASVAPAVLVQSESPRQVCWNHQQRHRHQHQQQGHQQRQYQQQQQLANDPVEHGWGWLKGGIMGGLNSSLNINQRKQEQRKQEEDERLLVAKVMQEGEERTETKR